MNYLIKILTITLLVFLTDATTLTASTRYHCSSDSVKVMELIQKASQGKSYGDKIVEAAKALQGIPLGKAADNDSEGTLVIRLDSLNQRELVYIAIAAAKTAQLSVPTIKDFEKYLENISRRKGKDEGFHSQFLYGADWIADNVYRGNLMDMTDYIGGGSERIKTLDYVSRHPEQFPAMADSITADKVKTVEFGFRSHRIPHLKKQSIGDKKTKELIKNGDIIILCSPDTDFDIYDIGIISIENGEPTLIHIPKSKESKVQLDPYPVTRLFKNESQHFYGYRWLRPLD